MQNPAAVKAEADTARGHTLENTYWRKNPPMPFQRQHLALSLGGSHGAAAAEDAEGQQDYVIATPCTVASIMMCIISLTSRGFVFLFSPFFL